MILEQEQEKKDRLKEKMNDALKPQQLFNPSAKKQARLGLMARAEMKMKMDQEKEEEL